MRCPMVLLFAHGYPAINRLNRPVLSRSGRQPPPRCGLAWRMIWTYHPCMPDSNSRLADGLLVPDCVDDLGALSGVDPAPYG